jgi:heme oxygenase
MISDIHRRLREGTHAAHEQLEDRVRILDRIGDPQSRLTLVEQFHRMHAEIEAAVAPWLRDLAGLDFEARRRTQRLEADLTVLGAQPGPLARDAIRACGVPQALGLMYVMEGSTLGGRVIRREVARRGGDMRGLSFLDPYGDGAGERWKTFLEVVASCVHTPEDVEALVAGARAGFRHAQISLCGEPAHV